ncbi:MAG: hypothetical protein HKN48_07350 [Flavobacteriaceae bacterium]|nr:hypothetical protein [Flavobacteriaceae bacterium]
MRNVFLLVAVFLGGITTQTIAQKKEHKSFVNGKNHRYDNSQSIRFVEDGILFTVHTSGTFTFTNLYQRPYVNGRRDHKVNYYGNYHKRRKGKRGHGYRPIRVKTDYFGNVIGVNQVCISYQRNGKVKQIGSVPLFYKRGLLRQIGGMSLQYNRFGEIRNTFGYINRLNRRVWHRDWYVYNDYDNDDWDDDDWDDDIWDDDDDGYVWEGRRDRSK